MSLRRVAILSPGEMGAATGTVLREHGLEVLTWLEGRSELTRLRAREAGFRDVASLDALVGEADLILSILVPAEAEAVAESVVAALRRSGARPVYADCNAIAPGTVARIAALVEGAGSIFVDAGIIGGPPRSGGTATRFHYAGPETRLFARLGDHGLNVKAVGAEIGQASGLKMVYAASTKGMTALWTELLVAARAMGLEQALAEELGESRGEIARQAAGAIPAMPRRARRWVGEMEEIATTFAALGLTPRMLEGAADIYRLVSGTALADQTAREPDPPLDTVLGTLAAQLQRGEGSER